MQVSKYPSMLVEKLLSMTLIDVGEVDVVGGIVGGGVCVTGGVPSEGVVGACKYWKVKYTATPMRTTMNTTTAIFAKPF
jgi:hypothetical protein